jgi:DNA-binding MarR family transcriptional regulator
LADKSLVIHSPDMSLEQKVVALLLCIAQEKKVEIERALDGAVQSLLQLNLLHALSKAEDGCLTVGQLRSVMVDESPNVSRTLNKLVQLGLVRKERSTRDQRTVYVWLTEAGARAHEEGDARLLQLSTGLERGELKQLFELLVKL